jgi:hypothetical protein
MTIEIEDIPKPRCSLGFSFKQNDVQSIVARMIEGFSKRSRPTDQRERTACESADQNSTQNSEATNETSI